MGEALYNELVSWSQLYILRAIGQGYCHERRIREVLHVSGSMLRQQINELKCMGLITKEGPLSRSWKLTIKGMDVLGSYGFTPDIHSRKTQTQKTEVKHTSTIKTGFKLAFGALLGIFAAWLLIGCLGSIAYWFVYHFLIKNYVPSFLLPYIPLDNLVVDLILGFTTSTAFFLPLRNRLKLPFLGGN